MRLVSPRTPAHSPAGVAIYSKEPVSECPIRCNQQISFSRHSGLPLTGALLIASVIIPPSREKRRRYSAIASTIYFSVKFSRPALRGRASFRRRPASRTRDVIVLRSLASTSISEESLSLPPILTLTRPPFSIFQQLCDSFIRFALVSLSCLVPRTRNLSSLQL